MLLLNGNCLELLKEVPDQSVDLVFCDLPYGQTSCEWDVKIDLDKLWLEFQRVKKSVHTPFFFTTTTKFGVELITSAPKNCPFRYDLIWVKSAPCGFLLAKKMPMRKHEMIYVFYEKLPYYDLSSHKHKFSKKATAKQNGATYGGGGKDPDAEVIKTTYDPPLPVSAIYETDKKGDSLRKDHRDKKYEPPLPVSVIKEGQGKDCYDAMSRIKSGKLEDLRKKTGYEPPLPVSVLKEPEPEPEPTVMTKKVMRKSAYGNIETHDLEGIGETTGQARYDPPLPVSILEVASKKGKHSTQKPVELMNWILKYYTKEGDVVLDPTMGSGSTGVSCGEMNREFIGFELDLEIFSTACDRLETYN